MPPASAKATQGYGGQASGERERTMTNSALVAGGPLWGRTTRLRLLGFRLRSGVPELRRDMSPWQEG